MVAASIYLELYGAPSQTCYLVRETSKKSGDDNRDNQSLGGATTMQTSSIDPTAPPEVITQQPPPVKPPRTIKHCHEEITKNVNMPTSYTNLRNRLNTLNENI